MTETVYISPSQVKTFLQCPRKWAFEKILGFRDPEDLATALGTRVHEILEAYLRDGTPPNYDYTWTFEPGWDETDLTPLQAAALERSRHRDGRPRVFYPGRIALTMMGPHLPAPGTGQVEGEVTWADARIPGTVWRMYKDWTGPAAGYWTVLDHKTSTNPQEYGVTKESLPHDPQFVIYGEHMQAEHGGGLDFVRGLWHYGARDASARKAKVVEIIRRAQEVTDAYMREIVPVAKLIRDHKRAGTHPLNLPANPRACGMYRGCSHVSRCNLTDQERIGALIMSDTSGFDVDSLLAQAGIQPQAVASPAPAAAPAPSAPAPQAFPPPPAPVQAPPAAPPAPPAPAQVQTTPINTNLDAALAQAGIPAAPAQPAPHPQAGIPAAPAQPAPHPQDRVNPPEAHAVVNAGFTTPTAPAEPQITGVMVDNVAGTITRGDKIADHEASGARMGIDFDRLADAVADRVVLWIATALAAPR